MPVSVKTLERLSMNIQLNNVHCTNCKKVWRGNAFEPAIGINQTKTYQCICGYYINVTNEVKMEQTIRYTSAYKKAEDPQEIYKDCDPNNTYEQNYGLEDRSDIVEG